MIELFETPGAGDPSVSLAGRQFRRLFRCPAGCARRWPGRWACGFRTCAPGDHRGDHQRQLTSIVSWVQQAIATVQPYIDMAVQWISENVKLQDVLVALGVAIAAIVVPALVSIVTSAAPILLVAAALIGAVALLRSAWEQDLWGIQEKVGEWKIKIVEKPGEP